VEANGEEHEKEIIDILVFVDAIGETTQVQQKRARSNDRL